VTYTLIIINISIFLITLLSSSNGFDIDLETLIYFGASNGILVVIYKEIWRLFSAMFLHGSLIHIAMNMLSLWLLEE